MSSDDDIFSLDDLDFGTQQKAKPETQVPAAIIAKAFSPPTDITPAYDPFARKPVASAAKKPKPPSSRSVPAFEIPTHRKEVDAVGLEQLNLNSSTTSTPPASSSTEPSPMAKPAVSKTRHKKSDNIFDFEDDLSDDSSSEKSDDDKKLGFTSEDESQELELTDEKSADTSGDKSPKPGLTQVATDTHPPTSSPLTSPIPCKASSLPLDIGKPRHDAGKTQTSGMSFFSRFWGVTKPLSELPQPAANNPSASSSDEQNLLTTTVTTSPLSSPGGSPF